MRVIAGSAKGRILRAVSGPGTRPITDRVKQALFDILGSGVEGVQLLDLFAGTGSVGIEALSRGAAHVTFVERDRQAVRTIVENLRTTGLEGRATVVQEDVFHFLSRPPDRPAQIVYIAPPQYQGWWSRTLEALENSSHLAEGGLAIVQIFPKEYTVVALRHLRLEVQRRYGSTLLCFYRSSTIPASSGMVAPSWPTTRNSRGGPGV